MPAVSLVVCLHQEGDLLQRMLARAAGCFDDLVVVHDGPDTANVRAIVEAAGGRFFERPREYQQEPHWPFAWGAAKHDWILRLDADEFPGPELSLWLQHFRVAPEPTVEISGYTCIWPLWDGRRQVTSRWPDGRNFIFHRQRVRFFGMVEQVPVGDGRWEPLPMILEHQPRRKSYGLHYALLRKSAANWRWRIATSLLLDSPDQLPHWRWEDRPWPLGWARLREHPVRELFVRLFVWYPRALREQWRKEGRLLPFAAATGCLMHAQICLKLWRLRRARATYESPSGMAGRPRETSNASKLKERV